MSPGIAVGIRTDNYEEMVEFYTAVNHALRVTGQRAEGVTNFGDYLAIRDGGPVTTNAELVLVARTAEDVDAAYSAANVEGEPPHEVPPLGGDGPSSYQASVPDPAGNTVRIVYLEPDTA